ncbi:MAG: hypothetical protein ACXWXT_12345, partial [Candidatus Binatia bacterium]
MIDRGRRYDIGAVSRWCDLRSRRLMAMFGADWRDPTRYDLILNMARMSRQGAKLVSIEAMVSRISTNPLN